MTEAPPRYVTVTCYETETHERQEMQSNCAPVETARLLCEAIAVLAAQQHADIDITCQAIKAAHKSALEDEIEFGELVPNG